jgi:hypothetical protein
MSWMPGPTRSLPRRACRLSWSSASQPAPYCNQDQQQSVMLGGAAGNLCVPLCCGWIKGVLAVDAILAHVGCRGWVSGLMVVCVAAPAGSVVQSSVVDVAVSLIKHLFGQAKGFDGKGRVNEARRSNR